MNLQSEINFNTSRSGGKGGQNVNKVETAVEAYWHIASSRFFTEEQKAILHEKLLNRINKEGLLMVKCQTHRTQLANKQEALEKLQDLVKKALEKKKARIATKLSKAVKERRKENKKLHSEKKQNRGKIY